MKPVQRLIPNRLRKYRLIMGYEQMEVAFLLGMKSHERVSKWETGVAMPNVENLLQLSRIYRTLPDELYYDLRDELIKSISVREEKLKKLRFDSG